MVSEIKFGLQNYFFHIDMEKWGQSEAGSLVDKGIVFSSDYA